MIPRPNQLDVMERCRAAYRAGHRRVTMQCATGFGKTICAALVVQGARSRNHRVLFVTHRTEIHEQTLGKLADVGLFPAELTAGKQVPDAPLIAASIQTLARRDVPPADLVIVDEAHCNHAQQLRLQEALPKAWFLMLTATPARLDGKPLPADVIVSGPTVVQLQAAGNLCPTVLYGVASPDVSKVPISNGDYAKGPLELAARRPHLVGAVPDNYRRYLGGRRTLLFASGVKHSLECRDALVMAGIRAVHVDGTTPPLQRQRAWADLRAHSIDVVCSIGGAIEGLDLPEVDGIYWARPTTSLTVYMQGNGRGMRSAPGKRDLVIVDAAGNWARHGLPETEHEWSLTGKPKRASIGSLSTCKECLAVYPASPVCPRCGAVAQAVERQGPRTIGGELVKITAAELERRARASSRLIPVRPCPSWAASDAGLWNALENKRFLEGYALGDGSRGSPGWTASMWRRRHRIRT